MREIQFHVQLRPQKLDNFGEVKKLVETAPCVLPYALTGKMGYSTFYFIHSIFVFNFKERLCINCKRRMCINYNCSLTCRIISLF